MRAVVAGLLLALAVGTAMCALPYDHATAIRALYYSAAVKCHPSAVINWTCGPACSTVGTLSDVQFVYNDSMLVRGFVGYDSQRDQIVLSYRGTENIVNWLEDFDFKLIPYTRHDCGSECKVHQGFYNTYEFMANTLLPATKALMAAHPSASFLITGHSLGAAQAQLCLIDIMALVAGTRPIAMYNFGEPRIGNPTFADWAIGLVNQHSSNTVYRLVNDNDPVPMVPLKSQGFQHYPREFIWLSPTLPAPGWVYCNHTGWQAEHPDSMPVPRSFSELQRWIEAAKAKGLAPPPKPITACGGSLWHVNVSDHTHYFGYESMTCQIEP